MTNRFYADSDSAEKLADSGWSLIPELLLSELKADLSTGIVPFFQRDERWPEAQAGAEDGAGLEPSREQDHVLGMHLPKREQTGTASPGQGAFPSDRSWRRGQLKRCRASPNVSTCFSSFFRSFSIS